MPTTPFVDLALARRLERAEGRSGATFVETRARLEPGSEAAWVAVAGALAVFDGPGSPLTQTFGLGLFDPVGAAELLSLEEFFFSRGSDVWHEVSPLAGVELQGALAARGYRPVELTSVMFRPLASPLAGGAPVGSVQVRRCGPGEEDLFARTAARGWSESPAAQAVIEKLGAVMARRPDGPCFLASLDGRPVAAGSLSLGEGVAVLAGASTVPEARRQGAQLALLHERLRWAAAAGCDLAMMCAAPGSASQRNAERHGFRVAYTRTKWQRELPPRAG